MHYISIYTHTYVHAYIHRYIHKMVSVIFFWWCYFLNIEIQGKFERNWRDRVSKFSKESEDRFSTSFQVTMKTASRSMKQNIPACLSSSFWGREAGSLQLTSNREGWQYLGANREQLIFIYYSSQELAYRASTEKSEGFQSVSHSP